MEEIERIWFNVKNMKGYDLTWEWMREGGSETQYLERKDVLVLIEQFLPENKVEVKTMSDEQPQEYQETVGDLAQEIGRTPSFVETWLDHLCGQNHIEKSLWDLLSQAQGEDTGKNE